MFVHTSPFETDYLAKVRHILISREIYERRVARGMYDAALRPWW